MLVQLRLQACACNKPKMLYKHSSSNSNNMASLQPTYKLQRYRVWSRGACHLCHWQHESMHMSVFCMLGLLAH